MLNYFHLNSTEGSGRIEHFCAATFTEPSLCIYLVASVVGSRRDFPNDKSPCYNGDWVGVGVGVGDNGGQSLGVGSTVKHTRKKRQHQVQVTCFSPADPDEPAPHKDTPNTSASRAPSP